MHVKTIEEMNSAELDHMIRTGTKEQRTAAYQRLYQMSDEEILAGRRSNVNVGAQHEALRQDSGYSPFDNSPFDESE